MKETGSSAQEYTEEEGEQKHQDRAEEPAIPLTFHDLSSYQSTLRTFKGGSVFTDVQEPQQTQAPQQDPIMAIMENR